MGLFKELLTLVLDNDGDFFTSGLQNAINNYNDTRYLYTILSCFIGAVCLAALFIRAILF